MLIKDSNKVDIQAQVDAKWRNRPEARSTNEFFDLNAKEMVARHRKASGRATHAISIGRPNWKYVKVNGKYRWIKCR